jgi:hypothetical protein
MNRTKIDKSSDLDLDLNDYPEEFIKFCKKNELNYPNIKTGNGKSLCAMLLTPDKYWDRESCDAFVQKYNIKTKDSIQLFNKHSQWGIATSEIRGKNYIKYPYELSYKDKMRKNFKFYGTNEEKNNTIDQIKKEILGDYVDVPNKDWQLGHKNPDSHDNSSKNLILQPPIQAKYRDNYIFIDTLTKIPTPKKLISMYNEKNCPYTREQLIKLKDFLNSIELD